VKFGTGLPHRGAYASPGAIRDVAQAAEDLGFDSVWTVDHVALVRDSQSMYDLGPEPVRVDSENFARNLAPLYECITTMTYLVGATRRIHVGSAVCVLPLRNPVYNAKQLASLAALSSGRLILGVGAGWYREEADAMGMPWDHRGARTTEHIEIMRKLWTSTDEFVEHRGRFYPFEAIKPDLRPNPPPPILVGGHSPAAKARAAGVGDGWMSHRLPPAVHARGMDEVRAAARAKGRDASTLLFGGSTEVSAEPTAEEVERLRERIRGYVETGTHHLLINTVHRPVAQQIRQLEWLAREILPEFRK
jgi:probable F420-dependent oxidoreductase